jgi:hypothetical protein
LRKFIWAIIWLLLTLTNTLLQRCTQQALASMNTKDPFYSIVQLIYSKSFGISICAAVIMGLLGVYEKVVERSRKEKEKWSSHRKDILRIASQQLFGVQHNIFRITLFKDMTIPRAFLRYFTNIFNGRLHIVKDFPTRKLYIEVWERYGSEYQDSKTFFVCNMHTAGDCEGIAGIIRQNLIAKKVLLPNISYIDISQWTDNDLKSTRPSVNPKDLLRVKEYMRKGNIHRINALKAVHVKARAIYGDILYNKYGKPSGVIVIDSIKASNPFTEDITNRVGIFAQILGSTL